MIYDYRCRDCGHEQEENHSWKETPTIECENCSSTDTYRVILKAPRIVARSPWQNG